jgi:hypothetical protein
MLRAQSAGFRSLTLKVKLSEAIAGQPYPYQVITIPHVACLEPNAKKHDERQQLSACHT